MSEHSFVAGSQFIELASEIVSAYVANNPLPAPELPALLGSIHAAIVGIATGMVEASPAVDIEKPNPAQIRKSVRDDGITSFIDGKVYKTLKRHLGVHGLDPHSYRERYGLPADYPMTAPGYAAQRSALAKQIGLGKVGSFATRQDSSQRRKVA